MPFFRRAGAPALPLLTPQKGIGGMVGIGCASSARVFCTTPRPRGVEEVAGVRAFGAPPRPTPNLGGDPARYDPDSKRLLPVGLRGCLRSVPAPSMTLQRDKPMFIGVFITFRNVTSLRLLHFEKAHKALSHSACGAVTFQTGRLGAPLRPFKFNASDGALMGCDDEWSILDSRGTVRDSHAELHVL
jgi:hypothetical protein